MHADDVRAHVARMITGQAPPWPDSAAVECARVQGVGSLLECCLRGTPAATGDAYVALLARAREQTAATMLRQSEVRRIAVALEQAGLPALLLKGNALSLWLYPEPQLRESGDIDLCLRSHADLERAVEVLRGLGYLFNGGQRSTHHEVAGRLSRSGRVVAEVDLHSRLVNSPLFAERFNFEELWASGVALHGGASVRYLCPSHALLHAAMHRAVDLSNGSPDSLKWLYDFHLFAARMSPGDWQKSLLLAEQRDLAAVLLRNLADTKTLFDTLFPVGVLEQLAELAAVQPLQHERLDDWWYVQRQCLAATPGVTGKIRWLAHRLLPTQAQMTSLYGPGHSWPALVLLRLRRGLVRAIASRRANRRAG